MVTCYRADKGEGFGYNELYLTQANGSITKGKSNMRTMLLVLESPSLAWKALCVGLLTLLSRLLSF